MKALAVLWIFTGLAALLAVERWFPSVNDAIERAFLAVFDKVVAPIVTLALGALLLFGPPVAAWLLLS